MVSVGVLLATVSVAAAPGGGAWLDDYGVALRQAEMEGRPLLVVLENPAEAKAAAHLASLSHDPQASQRLESYKLCRIDVRTDYGQRVAQAFKAASFPHTVVIDNTASVKLFKTSGQMSPSEWQSVLARYESGERRSGYTITSVGTARWGTADCVT